MSTALTKPGLGGGALISRDSLKQSLGNIAVALPKVATGGIDFLAMDKTGEWSYGQDGTVASEESIWAVNPATLQHGWIAWREKLGQEPIGEVMVSAMRPLPSQETLPVVNEGRGWQQQYGVEMLCISGPDEGAHVLYKNTTVGAIKLFNVYIGELFARVEGDDDNVIALVQLTSESYNHKQYGKTYNPILNYVEWRNPDDVSMPGEQDETEAKAEEAKAEAEAAPRTRQRAARQPTPEPTQAEEPAEEKDAEESDIDAQIAALMAKKNAAGNAQAAPAAEATPRRRERR